MAGAGTPDPARLGPGAIARLALLTTGPGAMVDGLLLLWMGPDAWLGAPYRWPGLASVFLALGAFATGVALLPSPGRTVRTVRRALPRLLPYADPLTNAATFLLFVFSTVAVYQGCLDIFDGAHAGGTGTGVADPLRLQILIGVASVLFTLVPVYLALALRWLIPMGRWADAPGGKDAYGTPVAPPSDPLVRAAMRSGPSPPPPGDQGVAVGVVTVLAALFVSIGIQVVEVGTDPIPPGLWLESQVALPIYAVALALGVLAVDASVRGLEDRFYARVRPLGAVDAPGSGFVQ